MSDLNDDERRAAALAIRGWISISFTPAQQQFLAMSLLSGGRDAQDGGEPRGLAAAFVLAQKLGITDLVLDAVEAVGAARDAT